MTICKDDYLELASCQKFLSGMPTAATDTMRHATATEVLKHFFANFLLHASLYEKQSFSYFYNSPNSSLLGQDGTRIKVKDDPAGTS